MAPRNKKSAKTVWVDGITKKVIPKKEWGFIRVIQDKVEQLRKDKVYGPIKKPPVILRSVKAKPGSVFAECEAFTK